MLDEYKISQNIAYQTIFNSVKKDKISHAYLIELKNSKLGIDFAYAVSKFFLCPNHYTNSSNCQNCNQCNMIDEKNYIELKIIKPDGNTIKKNQILELQNEFQKKSIIGKNKIYIIEEAEKLNEEAANSLLKFLEEPVEGIIAILLTNNIHQLYITIKSRCQVIKLKDNRIENQKKLIDKVINYLNLDELEEEKILIIEEKIKYIIEYIEYLENNNLKTIVFKNKKLNALLDDMINIEKLFSIITLCYKDILNIILQKKLEFFDEYEAKLSSIASLNDVKKISKKLNIIIELSSKLKYNVNANLILDKFVVLMSEV